MSCLCPSLFPLCLLSLYLSLSIYIFSVFLEAIGALSRFNGDANRAAEWLFTADSSKIADMLHTDPITHPPPRSMYSDEHNGTHIEMRNMGTSTTTNEANGSSNPFINDDDDRDQIELFTGTFCCSRFVLLCDIVIFHNF